ncbi:MAG: 4-(cytidine 5'-diphospho)-2-C-methyl-D-erythritol kinase, partial [Dictyoglomus sp.]
GKGEIVKKVHHQNLKFLLIFPPYGVSTKEIYSKIKKEDLGIHIDFNSIISDYERGFLQKPYNFLEKITFNTFKELREIKESIEEITPYIAMTGTGSTLFVIIRNAREQKEIIQKIEKYLRKGYKIKLVHSYPRGIEILT